MVYGARFRIRRHGAMAHGYHLDAGLKPERVLLPLRECKSFVNTAENQSGPLMKTQALLHVWTVTGSTQRKIVLVALLATSLMLVPTHAFATKDYELTFSPHDSQAYKQGSTDGFFGYPLQGHHTKDFFYGYENGTEVIWNDKGYADGLTGLPKWTHYPHYGHNLNTVWEKDYSDTYNSGQYDRNNSFPLTSEYYAPLPAHTNDNYMQYYVGFSNGSAGVLGSIRCWLEPGCVLSWQLPCRS
jgi:hypothetical protein